MVCRMRTWERYVLLVAVLLIAIVYLLWDPGSTSSSSQLAPQAAGAGRAESIELFPQSLWRHDKSGPRPGSRAFLSNFEWSRTAEENYVLHPKSPDDAAQCSMKNCFDFSRCHGRPFKVFVYPDTRNRAASKRSDVFARILEVIRSSRFYTTNPREACVFVPSLDTIDRDVLSSDYVESVPEALRKLSHWNGGRNHLLFNLFSGTWPDYRESVGFDTGFAMLAKASQHQRNFRHGFDISIPLFLKDHPIRGGKKTVFERMGSLYPLHRRYLVTFKGKRYLTGIGSEVRNAVHHLHNSNDVIMLTTCKHGKRWKDLADRRCDVDNKLYDKYDYKDLLENSTFCLVPRGRRLGSFRFLETMFAACIPVSMSNGYVLPFGEVLDWKRAMLDIDERRLLELPSILRFITTQSVVLLRQQVQFLAETYFSSIEKIVMTTLEILRDRVNPQSKRSHEMWNSAPGGLVTLPSFSQQLHHFPFYSAALNLSANDTYTAVILARTLVKNSGSPIVRLMKQLALTPNLEKIIVVWTGGSAPPPKRKWPKISQRIETIVVPADSRESGLARFISDRLITTNAILSLEEDTRLNVDEIMFAFRIWMDFPDRIVGYLARSHRWDEKAGNWSYSPRLGNEYSMIMLNGAFYHRYYHHLVHEYLPRAVKLAVAYNPACADVAFNFLVSHVTKHPPIKVAQKRGIRNQMLLKFGRVPVALASNATYWEDPSVPESERSFVYLQRQNCLRSFVSSFGGMPLSYSQMRLDPLLYRDRVSNMRKKFHKVGVT